MKVYLICFYGYIVCSMAIIQHQSISLRQQKSKLSGKYHWAAHFCSISFCNRANSNSCTRIISSLVSSLVLPCCNLLAAHFPKTATGSTPVSSSPSANSPTIISSSPFKLSKSLSWRYLRHNLQAASTPLADVWVLCRFGRAGFRCAGVPIWRSGGSLLCGLLFRRFGFILSIFSGGLLTKRRI